MSAGSVMREIRFHLSIPAHRYLSYYQGVAKKVIVRALDGARVQFPAEILRPFLTHAGIFGEFCLYCDDNNKLIDIRRVDSDKNDAG